MEQSCDRAARGSCRGAPQPSSPRRTLPASSAPGGWRAPRRATPERRQRTAFSLIELVISMAILSIGLVGAMRVFPVGLRASQRSELRSRAGMVAQRTVESLKVTPCAQLKDGDDTVDEFQVRTTITAPQLEHVTEPGRVKAIDVRLTWTQEGRPREFGVHTYVYCDAS